jgi:hypothetical protein
MVREQNLMLAHPAVQAAKARWDAGEKKRRHLVRHNLTFERLFELFKANHHSMNAIGEEIAIGHISRERVRQIYDKYFRELFEGQSGHERFSACMLKRRLARFKDSENKLFESPIIKAIVESARRAGCKVKAVPNADLEHGKSCGSVRPTTLMINGYKCSVHFSLVARRPRERKRFYGQVALSYSVLREVDVFIAHTAIAGFPQRTFVIPSSFLLKLYFTPLNIKWKVLYLPLEQLPVYNNRRPRFDIWQYEDAWHLLQLKA